MKQTSFGITAFRSQPGEDRSLNRNTEHQRVICRYPPAIRWPAPSDNRLDKVLIDLVASEPVRQVASAFLAGDRRAAFKVWALVVLFAWLEGHYRHL